MTRDAQGRFAAAPEPPCGTRAAYGRHLRRWEDPCTPCRRANAQYHRDRRRSDPARRPPQSRKLARIEDYLFIGGNRMSASQAAQRLGKSTRTITRYRKALREAS